VRLAQVALWCITALIVPASAFPSGILLGTGSLEQPNDLTRIEVNGDVWTWLDITTTQGMAITDAIAEYAPLGFTWATGTQVATLYDVFDISYASAPNTRTPLPLPHNVPNQDLLMLYIGITYIEGPAFLEDFAVLGWIDDHTGEGRYTYSCLSAGGGACSVPWGEVRNVAIEPQQGKIGTYLVHVPEPSTIGLLTFSLLGIAGIAIYRANVHGPQSDM